MNNDRGQSFKFPSITPLKRNNIYVATLHSVIQKISQVIVNIQFTYEIEVNNQIVYANRNISTQAMSQVLSKIGLNVTVTITS